MTALHYPATQRNREPILSVLDDQLPAKARILEVASGSGEHAIHFTQAMPGWTWTPSDPSGEARDSITAWSRETGLPNIEPPLPIDCLAPVTWPTRTFDALVAVNMVHISPWAATEGLFALANSVLQSGGAAILYGPFLEADVETAPSNTAFDLDLRRRNPDWGLRARDNVIQLASDHGLRFEARSALPANNIILVFRKA